MNGEYITVCSHDDAVNILRNAGDIVVLTVKHYRAATPFLQKQRKYHLIKLDNEYKSVYPSLFIQELSGNDIKIICGMRKFSLKLIVAKIEVDCGKIF